MLYFISTICQTPSYIGTSKRYACKLVLAPIMRTLTNPQLNVLISDVGQALLSDFGLAYTMGNPGLLLLSDEEHSGGTLRNMAPELITEGRHTAGKETDIWALGMTLLEVCETPWATQCLVTDNFTRTLVDFYSRCAIF